MDPDNPLDFWLRADRLGSPGETPTYQSAAGFGDRVLDRITTRDLFYRMPPLGSEEVDREAVELLRRWLPELAR
jgi:hypothetical protein